MGTQTRRRIGILQALQIDRLVYYESFDDVRNAIDREKRIKGWLRIKKMQLIVSVNPTWNDLSGDCTSGIFTSRTNP